MTSIAGRAWVFGDGIDTDVMAPGRYFKAPLSELAAHCLEAIDPRFAREVTPGDIVVAGRHFGIGSAREQAPMALKELGIGAILAVSYGRIFYRNALNFGIPALVFARAREIEAGDRLVVDPVAGTVRNATHDATYTVPSLPEHLMAMVSAGGLMPFLKQRLAAGGTDR